MRSAPKETAWRKSRKFGDVSGGRIRSKLTDGSCSWPFSGGLITFSISVFRRRS